MVEVRVQSKRRLEARVTYHIPTNKSYNCDLHYYLFSPNQLQISSSLREASDVLAMFQSYARYSSPEITLDELIDEHNVSSPLKLLERDFQQLLEKDSQIKDTLLIIDLQTLTNSVRHEATAIIDEGQALFSSESTAEIERLLQRWLTDVQTLLTRFRSLLVHKAELVDEKPLVVTAMDWADEAMSLTIEKTSLELYLLLKESGYKSSSVAQQLIRLSHRELSYRRNQNWTSVANRDVQGDPERLSYRRSALKKWAESALYLNPIRSKSPERLASMLQGGAAGIAMAFAVLALFIGETVFLKSRQWAPLVIIAYILREKIKDYLRRFINFVVPHLLADEITTFISPHTGRVLNRSKVNVEVLKADKIAPEILQKRRERSNPFLDLMPVEDVVHYNRFVNIFKPKAQSSMGPWINTMTVITRIRLDNYLQNMDDPDKLMHVSSEEGEFEYYHSDRLYHLHLVVREQDRREGVDILWHYRVVLNKTGIVGLENLSTGQA